MWRIGQLDGTVSVRSSVRRVKALSSSGCESRLVTIAPASSSRAVRGGSDMD